MTRPLNPREVVPPARARRRPISLPASPGGTSAATEPALDLGDSQFTPSVERLPLDAITPYSGNPRIHDERQITRIAGSIRSFGWIVPLVVDAQGVLIAGHARYAAARQLGLGQVPVIRADHLSRAEAKAYRLADNKLAEEAHWDPGLLRIELSELLVLEEAGEIDVSLAGFDTPELDIILDGAGGQTEAAESLELPDADAVAVSRAGDLWLLGEGRHRLLCGNALDRDAYALLMASELARLIITDPPFNVPIAGHVRVGSGKPARRAGEPGRVGIANGTGAGRETGRATHASDNGHREFAMAVGEMSEAEFTSFLEAPLRLGCEVAVDGAVVMVFMDWRHQHELLSATRRLALKHLNTCIWNKTNGGMGSLYRSKHELCGVFRSGEAAHLNNIQLGKHGRYRTNVWDCPGVNTFRKGRAADLADHPTVKPTALIMDAIKDVTHRGEVVLDMFAGSGTTALAAERTGRRARLMELDPLYVDVALRRWKDLTGQQAVLASTGQTFAAVSAERDTKRAAADQEQPASQAAREPDAEDDAPGGRGAGSVRQSARRVLPAPSDDGSPFASASSSPGEVADRPSTGLVDAAYAAFSAGAGAKPTPRIRVRSAGTKAARPDATSSTSLTTNPIESAANEQA